MKISIPKKICISIFTFSFLFAQGQENAVTVRPFLSEIVSQFPNVRDIAIAPSNDEVYFTVQSVLGELSAIVMIKLKNNVWGTPETAPFSGQYSDMEPAFSPDGLRLFFVSNRPIDSASRAPKDYDIWHVQRKTLKSAWSGPIRLDTVINTVENQFYPSVAESNALYFTCDGTGSKGKDDIFVSKWIDGKYQAPHSLSDSVNSAGYEFNAYIAPDESFLLYTCYNKKGGYGSGDLYISYNKGNDEWTTAINAGKEINSSQMDYCPFVDINSGTLYFTSRRSAVASVFEKRQSISQLQKEINKHENGFSRLYRVTVPHLMKHQTR